MFEHYYRELLNFLARKVRDRDAAADLTQESFARVYAAERSGIAIRDPRALLYRTARNLITDDYRRTSTRPDAAVPESGEEIASADEQAGPEAWEPENAAMTRQRFEAIANIVDQLPPRCREAFILVKFDGLTHLETAHRMGIAVKTVEMQIQIALNACWEQLSLMDGDVVSPRPGKGRGKKDRQGE